MIELDDSAGDSKGQFRSEADNKGPEDKLGS